MASLFCMILSLDARLLAHCVMHLNTTSLCPRAAGRKLTEAQVARSPPPQVKRQKFRRRFNSLPGAADGSHPLPCCPTVTRRADGGFKGGGGAAEPVAGPSTLVKARPAPRRAVSNPIFFHATTLHGLD